MNKVSLTAAFIIVFSLGVLMGAIYTTAQYIALNPQIILNDESNEKCSYEGKTYNEGDGFKASDGCNSCSCSNGQVVCTMMACDQPLK